VSVFKTKNPGTPAALQCAAVVVEILTGNLEIETFLTQLLNEVTQILFDAATATGASTLSPPSSSSSAPSKLSLAMLMSSEDISNETPSTLWGYDPDSIEKYFYFVQKYVIFSPHLLSASSHLTHIVHLAAMSLYMCRERAPIRAVLTLLQPLYYPITKKLQVVHDNLFASACQSGHTIVSQIILALETGMNNPLWPNFADTLYYIILGCEERGRGSESRQWVQAVLAMPDVMSRLTMQNKEKVFQCMFRYAPTAQKKFKALMQDVSKVCAGEQADDCFFAYD